jgi:iron complex outermembrane receptor protein
LDGLDVGAGIYYVGKRPVDEWTQKTFTAGHVNSVKQVIDHSICQNILL